LGLAALLSACATTSGDRPPNEAVVAAYIADKPETLRPLYENVIREGRRNAVLNHMRAGLAAMDEGHYDWARYSFEAAVREIETVYANNPEAAMARSLWHAEGRKIFKGEPYERAMAYYYLGLLDMMRGDYENARAAFKSGILQDAFAEEEQNRCDFALLIFLEGWTSQIMGDWRLADAAYEELKRWRPDFQIPPRDANALILTETGRAPRKLADGVGHYELVYRRGKDFSEERGKLKLGDCLVQAYPMEDVAWQAMTRGGRPVERILKGQVVFKRTSQEVGVVLSHASAGVLIAAAAQREEDRREDLQAAGIALGLVSVVPLAIASQVKTRADTRYWDNLPDAVHVAATRFSAAPDRVGVTWTDKEGRAAGSGPSAPRVHAIPGGGYLVWGRSRSALQEALSGPPVR
jgi:tetratricopeptide (TPR) repeat protein